MRTHVTMYRTAKGLIHAGDCLRVNRAQAEKFTVPDLPAYENTDIASCCGGLPAFRYRAVLYKESTPQERAYLDADEILSGVGWRHFGVSEGAALVARLYGKTSDEGRAILRPRLEAILDALRVVVER